MAEACAPVAATPQRMAALGPQRPDAPASAAQARARFFNSANAFNIHLPPVVAAGFEAAARGALAPQAPTGMWACDQSAALGCAMPATSPLMLARYLRIAPGDTLPTGFAASGSIWYVIAGAGSTRWKTGDAQEHMAWGAGDVWFVPGTVDLQHAAGSEGAVLWVVTDEPLLAAAGGLQAATSKGEGVVHYPAAEIERQLALVYAAVPDESTSGRALIFSSDTLEASRNIHPVLTLSFNTLAPGDVQPAHRHNSAAVTLIVDGDACFSRVDGQDIAWQRWHTMVTPPGAMHSHHNPGTRRAKFLIVQDGALYYHARTMGFTRG